MVLDRLALMGIAVGLAGYVAPVWNEGRLRLAFVLTLLATLLHIYTTHTRAAVDRDEAGA